MDDVDAIDLGRLTRLLAGGLVTQAVSVAAAVGIGDALGHDALSSAEVALRCGAPPDGVARLLRALATLGLVEALDADRFCLSDTGHLLRSDHPRSLRSWAIVQGQLMTPLWAGLLPSIATGEEASLAVFGVPFYEHLAAHAYLDDHWNRAMAETAVAWLDDDDLLGAVDWGTHSHVVDVGGGLGAVLTALLGRHRHLRGTLYDLANVVQGAPAFLGAGGVADRVMVLAGSFFESVPAGGDLYLLARVIFNWADDDALVILKRCRAAMADRARMLVIDHVLSKDVGTDPTRLSDLNLLAMGGRARTIEEWDRLAALADLGRVGQPRSSVLGGAWAALVFAPV